MKNLQNITCTELRIKKIGYIVICGVTMQLLIWGKRMALKGELRSMKKLIDPINIDLEEDLCLLRMLKEPHVKIASTLADYCQFEVLHPYSLVNLLNDEDVLDDEWATEIGWKFFWRYMFCRTNPRVRDRYVNFNRVLLSAQRVLFELIKVIMTHETRAFGSRYRSNYSTGRLKALMKGNEDSNALILYNFILKLRESEFESKELLLK